jgi:SAM-dependent methyltransferase
MTLPLSRNLPMRWIQFQMKLSRQFDRILPSVYSIDGNQDFRSFAWQYIRHSNVIWDVGGGKHPFVPLESKLAMELQVVGVDIDGEQVSLAPAGFYDDTVVADIQRFHGPGCADVVVCQALLEHVANVEYALASLNSILRSGGTALIFVPSRTALFAQLNRLLPEALKKRLLFSLLPSSEAIGGFPAFYDRCTVAELREIANRCGLDVVEQRVYLQSSYFSVFAPLHIAWRCWQLLYRFLAGDQAAETMSFALVKTRPAAISSTVRGSV